MGVYIKGMEMPKKCIECKLIRRCGKNDMDYVCMPARVYVEDLANAYKPRPDYCPLVPVPPHGRLIDASESIRVEFYDEEHEDWTRHDMTIDDLLSQSWVDADAPTIIPAEPCNNLSKPCKEDEP